VGRKGFIMFTTVVMSAGVAGGLCYLGQNLAQVAKRGIEKYRESKSPEALEAKAAALRAAAAAKAAMQAAPPAP